MNSTIEHSDRERERESGRVGENEREGERFLKAIVVKKEELVIAALLCAKTQLVPGLKSRT